jgi:hypothetical protein
MLADQRHQLADIVFGQANTAIRPPRDLSAERAIGVEDRLQRQRVAGGGPGQSMPIEERDRFVTGVEKANRIATRPTPLRTPPVDDHPTLPAAKTNAVDAAILYPTMGLRISHQQMKIG